MTKNKETEIRFLSFDLDGTLTGNPDATLRFRETWETLDREKRPEALL